MNPYHEGVDKSMPPHEERVRRASAAVFANAATSGHADYPAFHLAPPSGWMNDPNGLIYYRGRYHVFYQHNPYSAAFGHIHWGHASSADLIHWEHHPVALAPGDPYDKDGCFSGCAVEHDGKLCLIYTGHSVRPDGSVREVQCLADSTDGIRFEKHGVVIANPPPNATDDFRDPKVWREDGQWYLVVGYRQKDAKGRGSGCIALYRSTDLHHWDFVKTLFRDSGLHVQGQKAYMLECPDFFPMDGAHVLLSSPQGLEARGYHFRNVFQNGCVTGTWKNHSFSPQQAFYELDAGHDFYAAQSFLTPDGRRLLIAWFDMWESNKPTAAQGWAGMMTLPRELFMWDNRLCMRPAKEVARLRLKEKRHWTQEIVDRDFAVFNEPGSKNGLEILLECDLRASNAAQFGFRIKSPRDPASRISLYADLQSRRFVIDRNNLAIHPRGIRSCPLPDSERLTLRAYIDHTSVEVFVGDGQTEGCHSLSSRFYFDGMEKCIDFFTIEGGVRLERLSSWELEAVNYGQVTFKT